MAYRKSWLLISLVAFSFVCYIIPLGWSALLADLEWETTFGGIENDYGCSVQVTGDGGYIITGRTESFDNIGDYDVYLVKTDSSGNIEWEKTFGGSMWDDGSSAQVTADGGYIITGSTWSFGAGSADVYLVKTDSSGNLMWEKTFGGTGSDRGWSVQVASDGGYIVTGGTSSSGAGKSDVYLVKTDSNGNLMWEKTFGGTKNELGHSVQLTGDGGYIITGDTDSMGAGESDVYLIKTNPALDAAHTSILPITYTAPIKYTDTTVLSYIIRSHEAKTGVKTQIRLLQGNTPIYTSEFSNEFDIVQGDNAQTYNWDPLWTLPVSGYSDGGTLTIELSLVDSVSQVIDTKSVYVELEKSTRLDAWERVNNVISSWGSYTSSEKQAVWENVVSKIIMNWFFFAIS